jgi:hypothetical protein
MIPAARDLARSTVPTSRVTVTLRHEERTHPMGVRAFQIAVVLHEPTPIKL